MLNKWKEDSDLTDFVEYFERQWINSKFSNWQLFKVPIGFSMTNSPIESYNNKIKEAFTKRLKHHLTTAIEVFKDAISYESRNGKDFKVEIRVRKYMRDQAKTIIVRKQLIATNSESEYLYKHFDSRLGFARINIDVKSCTCFKYFDKGVCKHLVAACMQNNIGLPGMVQLPKRFLVVRRRNKRNYINESINDGVETTEITPTTTPTDEETLVESVEPTVPPEPKKRGRKPNQPSATQPQVEEVDKGGRPPLARNALVDDSAPTLRRSNRNKK